MILRHNAVVIGALNAVSIALPAAIVAQVVADEGSALRSICSLLVLFGLVLGGFAAARLEPDAPMANGAVAALAGATLIQVFGIIRRTANGDDVNVAGIIAAALLAIGCGVVGAYVAVRRAR